MTTIAEIATELAGHGPAADSHALLLIDQLVHTDDLTDTERWARTRHIMGAWTLVRSVSARAALGEFTNATKPEEQ